MAERRILRVMIVDDELLARQRLEDLLREEPDVEIVAEAGDGGAAVEGIRRLRPDLVFLDVQMPGKTGLDVVREVGVREMPATIFVTAYDQYALTAFDLAAVDYLMKPFDDERFARAFRRARRSIELEEFGRMRERLMAVLGGGSGGVGGNSGGAEAAGMTGAAGENGNVSSPYLERIAVEMKGKVRVVPVAQIDYITASGPYAELHVGDRRFVIREAMQELEERLDPREFMRIHRSAIVRLELIETLLKGEGGDYEVVLRNGARLRVSRGRREALERRLGVGG